jgi:hypothetical protein
MRPHWVRMAAASNVRNGSKADISSAPSQYREVTRKADMTLGCYPRTQTLWSERKWKRGRQITLSAGLSTV